MQIWWVRWLCYRGPWDSMHCLSKHPTIIFHQDYSDIAFTLIAHNPNQATNKTVTSIRLNAKGHATPGKHCCLPLFPWCNYQLVAMATGFVHKLGCQKQCLNVGCFGRMEKWFSGSKLWLLGNQLQLRPKR